MYSKKMAVVLGLAMSAAGVFAQGGSGSKGLVNSAGVSLVATQAQSGGHAAPARKHHEVNPDKAADRLGKKLNLSADQVAQIKPILADRQQQMQALRADSSLSKEQKHAKAKAAFEDSKTKIEAVLNDQQKQQFEQMLQERKAKRQSKNEKPQAQ
jgi:hypothetical protein